MVGAVAAFAHLAAKPSLLGKPICGSSLPLYEKHMIFLRWREPVSFSTRRE
jgi:hypothetical protein